MSRAQHQAPAQLLGSTGMSAFSRAALGIGIISGVVNLLALTSPIFMLQVYDRVLSSGSVPTLVGLAILAIGLYAIQAILEIIRARILVRIGEAFDNRLSGRVHDAVVRLPLSSRMPGDGLQPLRDLDNVRGFLSGQGPTALFDLPWMPLYLSLCFLFHFWIGMTALVGAIVLVTLTLLTNALSKKPVQDVTRHNMKRNGLLDGARRNAEVVRAMGMGKRVGLRWAGANSDYLTASRSAGDVSNMLGSISKTLRVMLQSAILGVGAYLVIRQEVTGGVMIASSIMMGRALAPVDLAIANWKPFLMARHSWRRLKELLVTIPDDVSVTALPTPTRDLRVEGIVLVPPGEKKPTVMGLDFSLSAGSALGVIGPSGSGKTTLSRALVNAWALSSGKIRLDGASIDQWDSVALGQHIGYLPQGVELFDGTIAQNIARFEEGADPKAIISAAQSAGAHDLILRLEDGYETGIGEDGSALSAGQRQRIGLARALYGDPFLVVLDEPNANLDAQGEAAVMNAIASVRARGGIAIVVAHRPSAIGAVDLVLVMEAGRQKAFGPRDEVLSKVLKGAEPAAPPPKSFSVPGYGVRPLRAVAQQLETVGGDAGDGRDV
ncbi:putative type I secretion system ATPase [Agrobacterium rubi TR3 = NBRC 13261]|uniref:Putative type I secretion system ATPase n=1 Tax=Agrobacterium rubi TR3 = NBRC 13261 TaxID=1368415 RepID=A0A081CTM6_9HYPH|nr:ATP-binding cassette subfamily C protein [Agrobacterium rubi]GAK70022.1 putative type I secretion system ATPase [Agrobacterium rubi TR3 = NBRC 13261]